MPQISESVFIALITFFAGALGALFGFLGGVISAKINADAQMKQTVVQEQFRIRSEAYQNLFDAHVNLTSPNASVNETAEFLKALQTACVVSSAPTSTLLMVWQNSVDYGVGSKQYRDAMASALVGMQHDLDNFTEPRIHKNEWTKKFNILPLIDPEMLTKQS